MNPTDLKERLRGKPLIFGKVCLPNTFSLPSPGFHRDLESLFLDPKRRRVCAIAPRDHAKSSLVALVFVLYHIFFDEGPKFVVLVSKTEGHAIRLLETIKNALEYSRPLRDIFGYWGEHTARSWTRTDIILADGTRIMVRGTGQQVRGLKHWDQRPTLIVLDDPEDENNTKTTEAMDYNLRWFLQGLDPAPDAIRGRIWVIGTPIHERCMVETLFGMSSWTSVRYQALKDEGPRELWTTLWPEKFSVETLLEKKKGFEEIGKVSIFYREWQCRVIGDEDRLFRSVKWWNGHLERDSNGYPLLIVTMLDGVAHDRLKIPVNVFMGVDPASSVMDSADYSAVVPIAMDYYRNRYVLPYVHARMKPMDLARAIIAHFDIYHPIKTRVESNGYQEMLRDYLREQKHIPGLEIKEIARAKKSLRLESLEPIFNQGKIFLLEGQAELRDELLAYPRGKNDDLLDALYYACKNNFPPMESHSDHRPSKAEQEIAVDDGTTPYMTC